MTSAKYVSKWRDWGLRNPHSDSLQAELPFNKDGAKFAARKVGVASTPYVMYSCITGHA